MKANRLALLMECHERELMDQEPLKATEARSVKLLIKDDLVEFVNFQPSKGPAYVAVKISDAGKSVLDAYLKSNRR
jgi:hypothetical protein